LKPWYFVPLFFYNSCGLSFVLLCILCGLKKWLGLAALDPSASKAPEQQFKPQRYALHFFVALLLTKASF
jgi:hypothetical protein